MSTKNNSPKPSLMRFLFSKFLIKTESPHSSSVFTSGVVLLCRFPVTSSVNKSSFSCGPLFSSSRIELAIFSVDSKSSSLAIQEKERSTTCRTFFPSRTTFCFHCLLLIKHHYRPERLVITVKVGKICSDDLLPTQLAWVG